MRSTLFSVLQLNFTRHQAALGMAQAPAQPSSALAPAPDLGVAAYTHGRVDPVVRYRQAGPQRHLLASPAVGVDTGSGASHTGVDVSPAAPVPVPVPAPGPMPAKPAAPSPGSTQVGVDTGSGASHTGVQVTSPNGPGAPGTGSTVSINTGSGASHTGVTVSPSQG